MKKLLYILLFIPFALKAQDKQTQQVYLGSAISFESAKFAHSKTNNMLVSSLTGIGIATLCAIVINKDKQAMTCGALCG